MSGAAFNRGDSKQDYKTPADFMAAVKNRFGLISWDLAADSSNTQCSQYFTLEMDSLKQRWHQLGGWLWLNPPYDRIEPWAQKCAEESALGARILFLVPASIGSDWYRKYIQFNAVTLALNGRLCFVENWETTIDPASVKRGKPEFYKSPPLYPKDCMLAVFCAGLYGFNVWKWK